MRERATSRAAASGITVVLCLSFTLLAACSSSTASGPGGASAPPSGAPAQAATAQAQIDRGQKLYGESCASCHGASGQGGKAPKLVGEGALPREAPAGRSRKVSFRTAADVFTWVKANMPPGTAGSLKDDEYVAILAFALRANGVKLEAPLDAASAAKIVLHP